MRGLGRDVAAGLGEDRDQRVLAQEGRLARHVGTGDEPEAPFRPEVAIVGDEASGVRRLQRLLDHGMPPAGDREAEGRSEEHTSELQSLMRISYAVSCLKKKKPTTND